MSFLVAGALATIAKGALTAALGPFVEEARDATLNAAQDAIRSTVAGRMSIDEWAEVVIKGVDKVKDRCITEGDLRYVGGKLKFAMSPTDPDVDISFQLYFLDQLGKWQKAEASSGVPTSKFTQDSLDEIMAKGGIEYEVE